MKIKSILKSRTANSKYNSMISTYKTLMNMEKGETLVICSKNEGTKKFKCISDE